MNKEINMIKVCFAAAFADGEVQDEEKKVLFDYAGKLGLDMSTVSEIWEEFARGERPAVRLPKKEEDRANLLNGILKVVLADHEVTRREDRFLRRIAERFGMQEEIERQREFWGAERWPAYQHKSKSKSK